MLLSIDAIAGMRSALVLLFFSLPLWASEPATLRPGANAPITISVFSGEDKDDFKSRVLPILTEQMKACNQCVIRNISPYGKEGKFQLKEVPAKLEEAAATSSFFFVDWNVRSGPETKAVEQALQKVTDSGVIVIAAAGLAKDSEPTLPLSRTVMGQLKGVVIIGELAERERLPTQSFFGPEMLTALKPPKGYVGQGLGPTFFAAKLAVQWNKRTASEWLSHFQSAKLKVRRIWPTLDDFFR
jgi:hypothetical protein